ncbi:hypothetical protein D1164_05840 [Mariniphaga sediminis]|jgi:hypothetical protein|uniref:Lipoprotein n=1 Tax=Mariniphaga sediminis TaxID=1628158 RepID=A0A399D6S7_9BACT|nr:DUF6146 family protein [Mariniphaga sediminis]MBD3622431.1 hypothetical protein [Sunxiuqinia sp.]RIH66421.1 hypothetical protein D1164_05840 [Mariniphaga sediminis]
MKQLFYFTGALLFIIACSTQKRVVKIEPNDQEMVAEDSTEYALETFDTKFDTWYALHNSPSQYRSQEYYESWNRQYVAAWNYNATRPGRSSFFEPIVGWDPTVDYGFELNHKLFYYFQYVERVLKIEIMSGGPKSLTL